MRIAHIITRMIVGGAQENTLYNCVDLIQQYGDDVLLLTGPAVGPEGKLLEQGRAGGLPVAIIDDLQRAIHPWKDYGAYRELIRQLRRFRPEVVHTHSAKGGLLGRAAAWHCKVPAILHTVHGAPFHPYQSVVARQFFIACEQWAAKRCHHMICVADAMAELMASAKVAPRSKFTTIYSGMNVEPFLHVDDHRAAIRHKLGLSDEHVVVGKIARLFHLKGHEYLVDAAARIGQGTPQLRYLIIGDGILRKVLEQRIESLGLTNRFIFAGLVPPEEIPKYLSAMDLLVHTSLREGLARTLPQALIAGRPVISYDIDGAREVVIDGETGFLLPPKSISELADAIKRLACDPQLRQRFGMEGRARFTDQFRHREMTRRIRVLYQEVLERNSQAMRMGGTAG